jgi:hypothetical protein
VAPLPTAAAAATGCLCCSAAPSCASAASPSPAAASSAARLRCFRSCRGALLCASSICGSNDAVVHVRAEWAGLM